MIYPETILTEVVGTETVLGAILLVHSRSVAFKAICLAKQTPFWEELDREFIWEASMLHDIGVVRTHAPKIGAMGDKPYIAHGVEGAKILEKRGLFRHARVALTHIGTGLLANEIIHKKWPIPQEDMIPRTKEEMLVCVADKFFSKSHDLGIEEPIEKVRRELDQYGIASRERFEHYLQVLSLS